MADSYYNQYNEPSFGIIAILNDTGPQAFSSGRLGFVEDHGPVDFGWNSAVRLKVGSECFDASLLFHFYKLIHSHDHPKFDFQLFPKIFMVTAFL